MPGTISSALWGKKDRGARPRAVAAIVVAAVALAAPAVAHAGGAVPETLLAQAKANPDQNFDVIIQTKGQASPLETTVFSITTRERRALNEAVKAANDSIKKATELAKKATEAAEKVTKAKQKVTEATAKAALTGSLKDQAAVAKAQAELTKVIAEAQAAQAAADAAQAAIVLAQMGVALAQGQLFVADGAARNDIHREFQVIPAVSARLNGADVVQLEHNGDILGVVPNASVRVTESNSQKWDDSTDAHWYWGSSERKNSAGVIPTVAIVDSGVDGSRLADFGGRMLGQIDLTSGTGPNSPADGRGHGTMVASLAAGSADGHSGVAPDARLISLDVIDDNGEGLTSDVIAAIDWILQNRALYNIRVANFSLQSSIESSFAFDPLSVAVERLWLNGVVVVAAAGNYATDGAVSGVLYAPASDPFVITVGAVDIGRDPDVKNDVAAPWSSYGYTRDGFLKPEISAPGRYLIAASPGNSSLSQGGGQDSRLVEQGYLQLSGTSFAAPIVSGAAAALLGVHPDWTPDQVKGALMVSASPLPSATFGSAGMGELDLKDALNVDSPPNPNAALNAFIVNTPIGPVVDVSKWSAAAKANASWNSASWSSASWSSASWSSASWNSASWASASWNSASWNSASWSSASWNSASWASALIGSSLALLDNAAADGPGEG